MAAVLASLILIGGLAGGAPGHGRWWAGSTRPAAYHIDGVPLVGARPNWCGPEVLAAVMQFHREEVTAEEIAAEIYLSEFKGALNLDLLLYARGQGFEARAGQGSAEAMREAIAGRLPVIAMVRRGNPLASRNHFVLMRGYDTAAEVWFLDDGDGQEERWSEADFEREWSRVGRWMLMVGPPGCVVPEVGPSEAQDQ